MCMSLPLSLFPPAVEADTHQAEPGQKHRQRFEDGNLGVGTYIGNLFTCKYIHFIINLLTRNDTAGIYVHNLESINNPSLYSYKDSNVVAFFVLFNSTKLFSHLGKLFCPHLFTSPAPLHASP